MSDVIDLKNERRKRAPRQVVFMPDSIEGFVALTASPGADGKASSVDGRVWLKAPPDGHEAWSLTPQQATDLAAMLLQVASVALRGGA